MVADAVLAPQAWRGGPQRQISRVLEACAIVPDDERGAAKSPVSGISVLRFSRLDQSSRAVFICRARE